MEPAVNSEVEYFTIAGCDGLKFFRCEPYRSNLSTTACSKRWHAAQTTKGEAGDQFSKCRSCPIGASHSGQAAVFYSTYFESQICPRCGVGTTRMIGGIRCINCYNREREILSGRNGKGTVPVKLRLKSPLDPRSIRCSIQGGKVRDVRVALSAHPVEIMVNVLRTTRGRVRFGFFGRSPCLRQERLL